MKKIKWILGIFLLIYMFNVNALGEATLKNIKVNNKECTCDSYECVAEVTSNNVTINYEKVDKNATVDRESGMLTSFEGEEAEFLVTVTNGENMNVYRFRIKKHVNSTDYTLKSLKFNDTVIELQEEIFSYNGEVDFDIDTINVMAECNDKSAKITSKDSFEFPLDESSKSIDISVMAENGDTKNYRIVLTRKEKPDTSLKSLKLSNGDIKFDKDTLEYAIEVEYSVTDIIVEAIPADEKSNVKVIKKDLVVGENSITIEVSNGKALTSYDIYVYREENLDKSLANLKSLKIDEYNKLDFDGNILDYDLIFKTIPKELNISAIAVNDETVISIDGNKDLKDGSVVIVSVSLNETHVKREYFLNIKEYVKKDISKTSIIVTLVIISIVSLILGYLELWNNKKKNNIKKIISKKIPINIKKEKGNEKEKSLEDDEDIEII